MRAPLLGGLALACWSIHATNHVLRGTPYDLFWACNVATLLVAGASFSGRAALATIATSWLAFGTPIWLLDLATGASMIRTSVFPHFGGLVLGILAVRRLGWPRGAWRASVAASAVLLVLTRLLTPAALNVNVAFRIHAGWETQFRSHLVFTFALLLASGSLAYGIERLARDALGWSAARPPRQKR